MSQFVSEYFPVRADSTQHRNPDRLTGFDLGRIVHGIRLRNLLVLIRRAVKKFADARKIVSACSGVILIRAAGRGNLMLQIGIRRIDALDLHPHTRFATTVESTVPLNNNLPPLRLTSSTLAPSGADCCMVSSTGAYFCFNSSRSAITPPYLPEMPTCYSEQQPQCEN
jgi:hypothetical protein